MNLYDVVKVVAIRDNRFTGRSVHYQRNPVVGDTGTILEIYTNPEPAYEVECSDPSNGFTIWLESMYPEELALAQDS